MSVEGLRIVVTGASSGLGAHTVRHLVAGGALVLAAQVAPISAASIDDACGRRSTPRWSSRRLLEAQAVPCS
jgi:NAD(P)-dependent dehydrogenase (short-subunit alcohol dehydrogenase family)